MLCELNTYIHYLCGYFPLYSIKFFFPMNSPGCFSPSHFWIPMLTHILSSCLWMGEVQSHCSTTRWHCSPTPSHPGLCCCTLAKTSRLSVTFIIIQKSWTFFNSWFILWEKRGEFKCYRREHTNESSMETILLMNVTIHLQANVQVS